MEYDNIVVEVGQVWYHRNTPEIKYQIVEIVVERHIDAYGNVSIWSRTFAAKYRNGTLVFSRIGFGELNSNGSPWCWDLGWKLDNKPLKPKKFSRVNPRSLRKRMRDQMAAEALTHRLTE